MGRNTLEQLTLFNLEDHEIKYDLDLKHISVENVRKINL